MTLREQEAVDVETVQSRACVLIGRRELAGMGGVLMPLLVLLSATGVAQISAPRYHSPIEAPTPQVTIPAPPPAVTANGTVVEYPIVRVNDRIIDNSDYARSLKQLQQEAQQTGASETELAQRQKDLLRDMIDQQLLLSRGKELDINADAEVIRRLDDIRKQNHLDSMEALEKAVRDQGISFEDWRSNIKNSIITQQVVRDEVGRTIRLTPREEQAYYDQHKQDFQQPEQVRLSEILIPTPEDATDAQVAQAKTKADDVEGKLKTGQAFDALAKQYSGGPNADIGGDLGEFKKGALPKVLEDQTFPLKVGDSTEPIRTRQGYVILKVTEHTPAGVQPLSAVEDQVQQAMYEQAIQPALRTYLTKLRENAFIDIAPGFVDTGASPKQTKPVFAAASQPAVKKKHAEKARLERGRAAAANGTSTPSTAQADAKAGAGSNATPVQAASFASNGKHKKIKREKIRFGQAPRNSLPPAAEETAASGADQGVGANSAALGPSSGEVIAPMDQSANQAANVDPFAQPTEQKKTRYTARQATEKKQKIADKANKAQQRAAAIPAALTSEEKAADQAQSAPLGLNGDTAAKKKQQNVKGALKERIQQKAPEPPAPKPEATPIPPRSVRDNGEPVVTPVAPAAPAATSSGDTQPAPPAGTPNPQ